MVNPLRSELQLLIIGDLNLIGDFVWEYFF